MSKPLKLAVKSVFQEVNTTSPRVDIINHTRFCFLAVRLLLVVLASRGFLPSTTAANEAECLARVSVSGPVSSLGLPAYAFLQDASGQESLLVIATKTSLQQTGWPYQVLDSSAKAEDYLLASEQRPGARTAAAGRFVVLHDDGVRWILRATSSEAEELAELGFAIQRLSPNPIVWSRPPQLAPAEFQRNGLLSLLVQDPLVQAMISRVQQTNLHWLVKRLTGEDPVVSGGEPYVISTRHTASGLPVQKALQFTFERLQAIGLDVHYHDWFNPSYTNRNVVATLSGGSRSNELVLITAHLDDMPSKGPIAPGADDNASGCAAVLTAASVLSQCSFDRSIRFVLFTGEEQGLLGSARYAAAAQAAGDNIVAVLNLDMIAWDGPAPPELELHTRTVGNPGYSNDLAIAATFTNVVAAYGLSNSLTPLIKADGLTASDHSPFWNNGYAAILAIEDYSGDFNPYYHTTNDSLQRLNLGYFTAFVQAAVATAAHLAQPVGQTPIAVVEVCNSDWSPGSDLGAAVFYAKLVAGATVMGSDDYDTAWSNAPANPNSQWLNVFTAPYGFELETDSRPALPETMFRASLSVVSPTGLVVSCSNRLRFDFLAPPAPDRIYSVRVHVDGQYILQGIDFNCVTNLRSVVPQGGYLDLPNLTNVTNGSVYGTCDIAARSLDTDPANCRLRLLSLNDSELVLATEVQAGTCIIDDVEVTTDLRRSGVWVLHASFTNNVTPDLASFDSGWQEITRTLDTSSLAPAPAHYFRLKRQWLAP